MALAAVAVLPHTYGGQGAVSYGEPFLTARSIAEPLSLFALAFLLQRRLALAIASGVLATIFHPLISLPVLFVGWFVLVATQRQWAWLGLLLLLPVLLGLFGLSPFDAMFRSFDPLWLDAIRSPNSLAFAGSYGVLDWASLAFDALLLVLCLQNAIGGAPLGRLVKATLAASALFSAGWVLGADVFHNVLLTQLQLWRVYWVMHLLAMAAMPLLGLHYWRRGGSGKWVCATLVLACVAVASNWPTGWLCVAWSVAAVAADRSGVKLSRAIIMLAMLGSCGAAIAISAKVMRVTLLATDLFPDRFAHVGPAMVVLGLPLVAGLASFAVIVLAPRGRRDTAFAAAVALAVMGFGIYVWDQRSPWQRRIEAGVAAGPAPFDTVIPPNAQVYWHNDLLTPWLLAQRANFYSLYQGAGLLFNRHTALEFARRTKSMEPLAIQFELCSTLSVLTAGARSGAPGCSFTREAVADVCHGNPHPDYLVFASSVESMAPVAEWRSSSGDGQHSFHLYSCASLR